MEHRRQPASAGTSFGCRLTLSAIYCDVSTVLRNATLGPVETVLLDVGAAFGVTLLVLRAELSWRSNRLLKFFYSQRSR
jgi:hypothetical protein